MNPSRIRNAFLSTLLLSAQPVVAKVEIEAVQHKSIGPMLVAKVSEDIAPGDYEVLMKGIMANPGTFAQKVVMLDSIGGSVPEAIRMGRLLRETDFDTLVPSTGVCQGTCVYLLAAGRKKTVRGHVGIHRPYYPNGDSAQGEARYNGVRYNAAAYLREMNVPTTLIDEMNRIDPRQMRVLSPADLARLRLTSPTVSAPAPVAAPAPAKK